MLWLLYTAEPIFLPTFRNWIKSFEEWEYENGLRHQLRRLAARRWVERRRDRSEAYCQLSHAGQMAALGNVNPPHRWDRPWDRKWRVLLFDVPASKKAVRARLLPWLRLRGFGFLQNSVWLHPDARAGGHPGINGLPEGVTALLALEARCLPGYSDAAIVTAAWDFEAINAAYRQYLDLLGVTYATSPMGADHTAGNALEMAKILDQKKPDGQVTASLRLQVRGVLLDSLGVCLFIRPAFVKDPNLIPRLLNARYGWSLNFADVRKMGLDCLAMERDFNRLAGVSDDLCDVPEFMRTEPLPPFNTVFDVPREEMKRIWDVQLPEAVF